MVPRNILLSSLLWDGSFYFLVQREPSPCRISAALFGAFGLVVLDLRRQACVLRVQNPSNIPRRNVLCSFFGADFRTDEALTAGNTWRIVKGNNDVWAEIRPNKTDTGSTPVGLTTFHIMAAKAEYL